MRTVGRQLLFMPMLLLMMMLLMRVLIADRNSRGCCLQESGHARSQVGIPCERSDTWIQAVERSL